MNEVLEERNDARFWQSRLEDLVEHYRPFSASGRNAEYIPALGKIDSNQLGICVIGSDQTVIKAGNWDVSFTLQSISKVISFIAACLTKGISYVLDRVDVEPTGDAFNSIIRLEMHKPGKPF
ncbi:glutaminase, partial [Bacillus paralicheniformis]|uniref:glutaminase n=2 Tax=Bacillaceae TaxID=186817 RepID=UPI002DB6BB29